MISNAWAQGAAQGPSTPDLVIFLLLPLFLFVFILWPQLRRQKAHTKMVNAIEKNDEVVMSGGMLGRVTGTDDNFLTIEIAKDVRVKVQRNAVTAVLPKGSLDA